MMWTILTFVVGVSGHKSTTDWCEDPTRHLDDAKNRRISTPCVIHLYVTPAEVSLEQSLNKYQYEQILIH